MAALGHIGFSFNAFFGNSWADVSCRETRTVESGGSVRFVILFFFLSPFSFFSFHRSCRFYSPGLRTATTIAATATSTSSGQPPTDCGCVVVVVAVVVAVAVVAAAATGMRP